MSDIFNKKKVESLKKENAELTRRVLNLEKQVEKQKVENGKYEALCDGICSTCVHGVHISEEDYKKLSEKCSCSWQDILGWNRHTSDEADRVICDLKAEQFCKNYMRKEYSA